MINRILIFTCLSLLLLNTSCNSAKEEEKPEIFTSTSAIIIDTLITKDYVCQIHAIQHIELRALIKGYLTGISVDEGQFVKEGQLMFQIMPAIYQAEQQTAQARADYAEIQYKNTKSLADSNVVSANQLALAKAEWEKAKAELQLATTNLGFTTIKAPFSGLMDHFHVRLGSLLDEGDLLTDLSDNSQMWVYFNVPEAEYLDYKSKINKDSLMRVQLLMANGELFNQIGIVKTIEADFDNQTGCIAFRATFQNPDLLLRHGETGNIRVTVPMKQVMIIPQKATFEALDKKFVYVIDKDNKLRSREVKIEMELPDLFVIKGGLSVNDKILLEGIRKVSEGDKVDAKFENPNTVIHSLKLHAE